MHIRIDPVLKSQGLQIPVTYVLLVLHVDHHLQHRRNSLKTFTLQYCSED